MKISKIAVYRISIVLCILLVFVSGKILYKYGNTEVFGFLSKPVAAAVAIYYGSDYHYNSDHAFAFDDLMIVIDKSCSGFNFFMISIVSMLLMMALTPVDKKKTLLTILMIPLIAYITTLLTNTSRIINLIEFQNKLSIGCGIDESLSHTLIGSFIYMISLLIIHTFFRKMILNTNSKPQVN